MSDKRDEFTKWLATHAEYLFFKNGDKRYIADAYYADGEIEHSIYLHIKLADGAVFSTKDLEKWRRINYYELRRRFNEWKKLSMKKARKIRR